MPIKEIEVKSYNQTYICDKCEKGEMKPTGLVYETYPPLYPHICSDCDHKATLDKMYPRVIYK